MIISLIFVAAQDSTFSSVTSDDYILHDSPFVGQTMPRPRGSHPVDHFQLGRKDVAHSLLGIAEGAHLDPADATKMQISFTQDLQMHVFVPSKRTNIEAFSVWDTSDLTQPTKGFGTFTSNPLDLFVPGPFTPYSGPGGVTNTETAAATAAWDAYATSGDLAALQAEPTFQTLASLKAYFKTYWSDYDPAKKRMVPSYTLTDMADGSFPLILFVSGDLGNSGAGALRMIEAANLASHGYVVVTVDGDIGRSSDMGRPMNIHTSLGINPVAYELAGGFSAKYNSDITLAIDANTSVHVKGSSYACQTDDAILATADEQFATWRDVIEEFIGDRVKYDNSHWIGYSGGGLTGANLARSNLMYGVDSEGDAVTASGSKTFKLKSFVGYDATFNTRWRSHGDSSLLGDDDPIYLKDGLPCPYLAFGKMQGGGREYDFEGTSRRKIELSSDFVRQNSALLYIPANNHFPGGDGPGVSTWPPHQAAQSLGSLYLASDFSTQWAASHKLRSGTGQVSYLDLTHDEQNFMKYMVIGDATLDFISRFSGTNAAGSNIDMALYATSLGGILDMGAHLPSRGKRPLYNSMRINEFEMQTSERTLSIVPKAKRFNSEQDAKVHIAAPLIAEQYIQIGGEKLTASDITKIVTNDRQAILNDERIFDLTKELNDMKAILATSPPPSPPPPPSAPPSSSSSLLPVFVILIIAVLVIAALVYMKPKATISNESGVQMRRA